MPQASDELRAEWPGGDDEAQRFLEAAGYKLQPEWFWTLPAAGHQPTDRERSAAQYLIDEWDFDGIEMAKS